MGEVIQFPAPENRIQKPINQEDKQKRREWLSQNPTEQLVEMVLQIRRFRTVESRTKNKNNNRERIAELLAAASGPDCESMGIEAAREATADIFNNLEKKLSSKKKTLNSGDQKEG